jgi:hypothetical protein
LKKQTLIINQKTLKINKQNYKINKITMKLNKYKVEFTQSNTFVIDVKAESEEQARELATKMFDERQEQGMAHYYQTGFAEDAGVEISQVYDVTDTDDAEN